MNDAARSAPPARTAVASLALVAALAAAGASHHGPWAGAEPAGIELLHAGAAVVPPLVELHASPEPASLELVALGVGDGAELSVRVVRHSHWGDSVAPDAPTLDDHGGGEATLAVDRSSPGEVVLEATATGASGGARALYVVRVLDALPAPGGHDGAAPSRIVGSVDPDDPALPRILAQAGRPLCAETPYSTNDGDPPAGSGTMNEQGAYRSPTGGHVMWGAYPAPLDIPPGSPAAGHLNTVSAMMSGVPPLEGMGSDRDARAVFGQQLPQWIYLDRIEDPKRERYYLQYEIVEGQDVLAYLENPYTGITEAFGSPALLPSAAAPGPYWRGSPSCSLDPLAPSRGAHLYFGMNGTVHFATVSVDATRSFVPELLPLDGTVLVLATAFHCDMVTFSIPGPFDAAASNIGRHLALEPPLGATRALVNDTAVPLGPGLSATVRVSEIARQNGILVEGITDGEGGPDTEVKKLHEITLAAEIPVDVGDVGAYELSGTLPVAPWECWPRFEGKALVP